MLGKDLRARRLALGLSQTELGAYFGYTKQSIITWERKGPPRWVPLAIVGLESALHKAEQARERAISEALAPTP